LIPIHKLFLYPRNCFPFACNDGKSAMRRSVRLFPPLRGVCDEAISVCRHSIFTLCGLLNLTYDTISFAGMTNYDGVAKSRRQRSYRAGTGARTTTRILNHLVKHKLLYMTIAAMPSG
jgi:hypothetical protein